MACRSVTIIRKRRVEGPSADLSVQFGIWIVALVGGPASPQFSGVRPTMEDSIKLCRAHLLCHSASQNPCFARCSLLGQEGAVSCLTSFLPAFRAEAWKGPEVVKQDRTFSDPWQEA